MDAVGPARARFGVFELDLKAGELHRGQRTVLLQEQPFQVLRMLVEHHGEVVLREEIRRKLWPNDTVVEFDNAINTAIKKLRQALGDSADKPRFIETVARRGYRLLVPVQLGHAIPKKAADSSLIGQRVSHYRVLTMLGGGGMGLVYKAEDLKLNRPVALKFLPEELAADALALQRFEREARMASSLNHPNICTIYGVEEYETQPFIVMELLEGEALRELISRYTAGSEAPAHLPLEQLLEIGIQIADGLEAAHQKSIIHRDIKPANIFVTTRGQVKILDFGLAKVAMTGADVPSDREEDRNISSQTAFGSEFSIDHSLSRTGIAMGTAGYMSPEQVRGERLDSRTDLFSFGLILFEMATGQRAFSGDTAAIVQDAILHRTLPPVRQLTPELPAALEKIVERALEKNRELRFQTAAEMLAELKSTLKIIQAVPLAASVEASPAPGDSCPVKSPSGTECAEVATPAKARAATATPQRADSSKEARGGVWNIRSRTFKIVVGACAFCLLLAAFGIYLSKPPPTRTEGFRFGPSGIDVESPMWSPDGKAIVYVAKPKEDTRDQLFLRYLDSPVGIQLTHMPPDQTGFLIPLGWSNDRGHIIFAKQPDFFERRLFRVYSIPTVGGIAEFVMDHRLIEPCCAATLSPDGKALASFGKDDRGTFGLYISAPLGTEPRPYLPAPFATKGFNNFPALRFSPDGKKLLFIVDGGDGRQAVWLLPFPEGSKPPRQLSLVFPKFHGTPSFDWMPDSRHIVVCLATALDLPAHLWVVDTETASMTPLTGGPESQQHPLVAPDGKSLLYCRYASRFSVVSVSVLDGATKAVIDTGREESMPSWSAKTGKLVWVSNRNGPYEIWLREVDGSERPVVTAADFPSGTNMFFLAPAISPDGERIIYDRVDASGVSRLWISSLAGGPPRRLTKVEPDFEAAGSWSPDGDRFVYVQQKDDKLTLMVVNTGGNATPEALKDWVGNNTEIPDWSPSGNWITFQEDKGWNLISPDGKTSKILGRDRTHFLAFSKDGKLLYGLHQGEPGPGFGHRGILFSLDPVTLRQKVIKDLGRSFEPRSNFGPGIRFSFAPDGQSFVYAVNQSRIDWWILQGLPQPGWSDRLRSLFSTNSKRTVSTSGQDRP